MKRYIWHKDDDLSDRSFNRAIVVHQLIRGKFPRFVGGNYRITTASYKGDDAVAAQIISDIDGHKMDRGGYYLINRNIEVRGI